MEDNAGDDIDAAQRTPFERVYRGIVRGLYEGRYAPGQRLVATDLMRTFGVGRGTVREVLQRLASTGVLRITPHKGAEVRRLSRREVAEVLDVVQVLLGLAARGATQAVADAEVRKGLNTRSAAFSAIGTEVDFERFVNAREDYYRYLVGIASNRELQRLFPNVQVHIMRVQLRIFNRAADSADPADYAELTEAVLSGDPKRAELAGRLHVEKTIRRVQGLPERAFEPDA